MLNDKEDTAAVVTVISPQKGHVQNTISMRAFRLSFVLRIVVNLIKGTNPQSFPLPCTVEVMSLSSDMTIYSFLSGLVIPAHDNGDGLCALIIQITFIPLASLYLLSTLALFIRPHIMYLIPLSMVAISVS